MSEESVLNVKSRLLDLFSELEVDELQDIEKWIVSQAYKNDLEKKKAIQRSEKQLLAIAKTLRKIVPLEAEMPSEIIAPPVEGTQADCTKINTCHVDEFLYDDQEVDELVKSEKLSRYYCSECNSRKTKELIFISHSLSRQILLYIFKVLLPKDLEDKNILDLGSRLGTVLYSAYYLTNASSITGIEINKECCEIQENMIEKYSMNRNRIKVICADILDSSDILRSSDIFILNILDFFVDTDKHKHMWYFLKMHLKKGSYLITNRSMPDTLNGLGIYEDFVGWLSICKPNQIENEIFFDIEDYDEIYLHSVN